MKIKNDLRKNFKFSNTGNAFLFGIFVYYIANLILGLIFSLFPDNVEKILDTWVMFAINGVAFIGAMYYYSKRKNVDFLSATKLNGKINGQQAGILILISIFCIIAFLPLANIFLYILEKLNFSLDLSIPKPDTAGTMVLAILLLAVVPAFSEEILMRGVVLNAASQKRDYSYAILITAGMFSLMHGNAIQTVHQFFLGMVLAYVVLVTKSLWASIIIHFTNNLLSIVLDYPLTLLVQKTNFYTLHGIVKILIWILIFLIGSTILFLLLRWFTSVTKNTKKPKEEEPIIIDIYPEGKPKVVGNSFKRAFMAVIDLFKKGGFKRAYRNINIVIDDVAPLDEDPIETISKDDLMPSNIKLAYTFLIVIWIVNFIYGFIPK